MMQLTDLVPAQMLKTVPRKKVFEIVNQMQFSLTGRATCKEMGQLSQREVFQWNFKLRSKQVRGKWR